MGSEIYFLALHNRIDLVTVTTAESIKKGALYKAPFGLLAVF